ncbi:hypothetical protein [Dapis sp. BLCC M172]|uniref:hypothetical protein n=1 Tax=Dapis sp. BLCC M172 TaxID=2975281 RepID=UPI003CEAA226
MEFIIIILIIIAVIFIIGICVGAGGTYTVLKWKHILIALKGKKLAVLGSRGTGKTTLLDYLTQGIQSKEYELTYYEPTNERRFMLDENTWISLKKSADVGGDTASHSTWQTLFKESDLVFYLVRADLLIKKDWDTQIRVETDLSLIQNWWQSYESQNKKKIFKIFNKKKKKLLIICTFCDQVDQLQRYIQRDIPCMIDNDKLRKNFSPLHKYSTGIKVVLGSLSTKDNTKRLVELVFKSILK